MSTIRLDRFLVEKQRVASRTLAQKVIRLGAVRINTTVVYDVAKLVAPNDDITIEPIPLLHFVSQGALKLVKAINVFGCSFRNLRVWDIGASTGGFTQCALEYGASIVYATDVGHNQLHPSLQKHPRIKAIEGLNAKDVTPELFEPSQGIDAAVCDVSFISIQAILPALALCLPQMGWAICLVKPQFETGARFSNKHGVVHSSLHPEILQQTLLATTQAGFSTRGLTFSPLGDGKQKNIEYLILIEKNANPTIDLPPSAITTTVHQAQQSLN
ncbi:MAG: TlyA family RNA methyltransferase [Bacteroides sp.]